MNNSFIFLVGLVVMILVTVGMFTQKNNSEEPEQFSGVDP